MQRGRFRRLAADVLRGDNAAPVLDEARRPRTFEIGSRQQTLRQPLQEPDRNLRVGRVRTVGGSVHVTRVRVDATARRVDVVEQRVGMEAHALEDQSHFGICGSVSP